jgi:tRNA threonylcarbamoyladenosine biosynthesis protein TsaE
MVKKTVKIIKNKKEMAETARVFLNEILKKHTPKGKALVVGLSGDLGAGKTTFVQSIAKHLNIKNKITSPTFVIIKKYRIKNLKGYEFLFHLDAYRLKNEKELNYLGWEEIVSNKGHIVFIEWPENVPKAIPRHTKHIHISHSENEHRKLKFK